MTTVLVRTVTLEAKRDRLWADGRLRGIREGHFERVETD